MQLLLHVDKKPLRGALLKAAVSPEPVQSCTLAPPRAWAGSYCAPSSLVLAFHTTDWV